jgi:predicted site-specific integrase-resolvase
MTLLKTKEVAELLGYTQRNIALMVKAGKLRPVNTHKDFFLFDAKEIELFNSKKVSNDKE